MQERLLAVVPITGTGTYADTKRPLLAPTTAAERRNPTGITAYRWEPSDDGKYAIVEFTARHREAFAAILRDGRAALSFEKGRSKRADIERAIRVYKKDFSLDSLARRGK